MSYAFRLTLIVLLTVPLALLMVVFGLFDPNGKHVYRIGQFWAWSILRAGGVALKVEGLERLDPGRQYVFMVNHQSNVDIPVLVQSFPMFQLRWMAKKELLWVPFFGWAMWASKHITVDRSKPSDAVKSLQRAKARIAAGISVVIFPEGTRSRDGKLLPFKKGGFLLAAQSGAAIVPVTINGSATLLPAGAWRLQPGVIEVIVGEAISVEGYRPGNLRLLSEKVRAQMAARLRPSVVPPGASVAASNRPAIAKPSLEKQSI
jgi:1-acyl-sn-glycerol-3-phosphate acyltransferase